MLLIYLSLLEKETDRKRFADVYEANKFSLLSKAKSITKDIALAEDAVHNAFINIAERREHLSLPDNELKALLISVVKRRAYDIMRKENRESVDYIEDLQELPTSDDDSVEFQIMNAEEFQYLSQCIAHLNEQHRAILQMKYFSELPNEKIGSILNLSKRQVETLLYRAKLNLRRLFVNREGRYSDV